MGNVKNGGRQDYVCAGCGDIIEKGTTHTRTGNAPNFKRYHDACVGKKPATTDAVATETGAEAAGTTEPVTEPAPVPATPPKKPKKH